MRGRNEEEDWGYGTPEGVRRMTPFSVRGGNLGQAFTRSWYSRVSVLTRILSPCLMNNGTFTFKPVSHVMTFVAPLTVSPRSAFSASETVKTILVGSLMSIGVCSQNTTW